jgi:hypothetical protein
MVTLWGLKEIFAYRTAVKAAIVSSIPIVFVVCSLREIF